MRVAPLLFLTLAGCPAVTEDVPGRLYAATVVTLVDSCTPQRTEGDAGVLWLGTRADGGLALALVDQVKYGPTRDGGVLTGISREWIPPADDKARFGDGGVLCTGTLSRWRFDADGGLELSQEWPGFTDCLTGPDYLPNRRCFVTRRLTLEPREACPQRCVVLSNDGAACDCSEN